MISICSTRKDVSMVIELEVTEGTFNKRTRITIPVSSISIILNIVDLPLTTPWLNGRKLEKNGRLHIPRRLLPYHQH